MTHHLTRRDALVRGAAVAAAPLFASFPGLAQKAGAPREKIGLGLIGAGGMGSANLRTCLQDPDTRLVAVCDVQPPRMDAWTSKYPDAKAYGDWRDLVADPGVDAVIIGTTPHWHCLMAVEAAKAKKHVFLQKPATLYPAESIAVRNAIAKHGVISQVGTQIHQAANYRRAVDWVRSGQLGPINRVECFWGWNSGPGGVVGKGRAGQPVPDGVDWEMFCGPAGPMDYHPAMISDAAAHSGFWRISGGWSPGMAPHIIDLAVWALELGFPRRISAFGGRHVLDNEGDAPDSQDMMFDYGQLTLRWHFNRINHHGYEFGSHARALGTYFHGLNGTLRADYGSREVIPQNDSLDPQEEPPQVIPDGMTHEHEWLQCIREGTQPSCNMEYHVKVDLPIVLGNLSYVLGRTIHFDPETLEIVDDPVAAKLAIPEYHGSWEFPAEYLKA